MKLERIYTWLLILPAVLPVIIWNGLIYPYLVPKTLLFYALSLLSIGVFAVLVAERHTFFWARLKEKGAWIPAALLLVAYVSSMFGTDFYRSFWSLLVRGDGLLMLTCAVTSFYLILLYADRAFSSQLLRTVAAVASFVALYGIIEWLISGGRIGSLLGNAAFFAGYLGLSFFATLAAANTLSGIWRRTVLVGAGLQFVAIILTATRGTMLALGVAGATLVAYFAVRGEGKSRTRAAWVLVALAVCGGLFFTFRAEIANVPFTPIARIASISTSEQDVASRLFIWEHMTTEIQKAPMLGVGGEHVSTLFSRFYDPSEIREEWFDRSHNAFLDYAAQYGIAGLALYLALIGMFFVSAARLTRRGDTSLALLSALLAITYAVQNFFVFDTVSSFWLILALLALLLAELSATAPRTALAVPAWARIGAWTLAGTLAILIIPVAVYPARSAYNLAQAYAYQIADPAKEIRYLSSGMSLGTYSDVEYGYQTYDMYVNTQVNRLSGPARIDAYQASLAILTRNFNRYAYDARTALYLAHVLTLAPEGVLIDKGLLSSALERAIRLSPKRSQAWYILANLSISLANQYPAGSKERAAGYAAAEDTLRRYMALVPDLSASHFVLAQLLHALGRTEAANTEAALGKSHYKGDLETAKRAAVYYENVRNLEDAAFFLREIVAYEPTNTAAVDDLEKIQAYEQSRK